MTVIPPIDETGKALALLIRSFTKVNKSGIVMMSLITLADSIDVCLVSRDYLQSTQ